MFQKALKELTILFAEDEEAVKEPLVRTLKLLFKDVIAVSNGKEALKRWQENKAHIIMTDYMMPEMDGMEFIREVRRNDKKTPIIILSSHTDKEKLKEAIKVNLIDYLEKPATLDDLLCVFKEAVKYLDKEGLLEAQISQDTIYNRIDKVIKKNGEDVLLTKNEAETLELLLDKRPSLVTYEDIANKIYEGYMSHHQLKNTIGRLKKNLGMGL